MAAPNCLKGSQWLGREFAESCPSLASIHGQLLFLLPQTLGHYRRTSEEVGEVSPWASGLAGQCPPHPAQGSACQPRACQLWHAAWICVACGLRLG